MSQIHTPQLEHPQLEQSPEQLQVAHEHGDMMRIEVDLQTCDYCDLIFFLLLSGDRLYLLPLQGERYNFLRISCLLMYLKLPSYLRRVRKCRSSWRIPLPLTQETVNKSWHRMPPPSAYEDG